jgi:HK97 gp10 family phage protein
MIAVDMKGLAELERKLRQLAEKMQGKALRQATNAGAQVIKRAARARVPVDTGLLKRNIVVGRSRRNSAKGRESYNIFLKKEKRIYANTRANRRRNRVGKKYEVDGPAFYGKFVEMGTSKMAARPFLRPAFEASKQAAVDAVRLKLAEVIKKTGGLT